MKTLSIAGAVATMIAFGTTMALAQSGPHIGDGSNSAPVSTLTPGYSVGTGSAHLGDGSNTTPLSTTTPGYNVAGGVSDKGANRKYTRGPAQSLAPPPGMAQAEGSQAQDSKK